jgi:MYXO-CTERM domain-containing protein
VGYDLNTGRGRQEVVYAADWHYHVSYDPVTLENDIGIVHLASPVTTTGFMPVAKRALTEADIGDDYRYVGWGYPTDTVADTSKKRTADIPLEQYDAMFMYGYDPVDDQNICSGDSGGAALRITTTGHFELAAVNSFVSDDDATYCDGGYTGGIRVDKFIPWIENFTPVSSAAEIYGDADPDPDTDTDTGSSVDTDTDPAPAGDPSHGGSDTEEAPGLCAVAGPGAGWLLALAGAAALRRRRRE